MPVATLEFAALCLANSLQLLAKAETTAINKLKEELGESTTNVHEKILVPAAPSPPMKADEVQQLRYKKCARNIFVTGQNVDWVAVEMKRNIFICKVTILQNWH